MSGNCSKGLKLFPDNSTELLHSLEEFRNNYGAAHGYLATVLCVFGIVSNIINIVVLSRPELLKSPVNVLLRTIAFCDLGIMLMCQVYVVQFVLRERSVPCAMIIYTKFWCFFLWFYVYTSVWLHVSGLWLAVSMALIRFMTMKKAQPWSKWQKKENAQHISYAILVLVGLCSVIVGTVYEVRPYVEYGIEEGSGVCLFDNNTSYQAYMLEKAGRALSNNCFLSRLNLWVIGLVFKIFPCILLAILSFGLLHQLKKAGERSKRMRSRAEGAENKRLLKKWRKMDKTNSLLVLILIVSLVTQFPQGVLHILDAIFDDVNSYLYETLGDIIDLLSLLNSSFNFIIYCIMSSQYRQTLLKTLKLR